MSNEKCREFVRTLQGQEGNDRCAECDKPNPQWTSVSLGIFVCIQCSGVIRSLQGSRVHSVELDQWTPEMAQQMEKRGNHQSNEKWAANVPPCWIQPNPNSPHIFRKQWIKAKYFRKEFTAENHDVCLPYASGLMHGPLFKKMKSSDGYKRRHFVLKDRCLKYYISEKDRSPKNTMAIAGVNVTLDVPGMENRPNSMLINYRNEKGIMRSMFVYAESGQAIMEWFCAIRSSKMLVLKLQNPLLHAHELAALASRDFTLYGELCKMPPRQTVFQKRFFVLDGNVLRYFHSKKDAYPLGEIILRREDRVDENVPTHLKHYINIFMLHTSSRARGGFPLLAQTPEEKTRWMVAIHLMIDKVKRFPQQYTLRSSYCEDDSDTLSSGSSSPPPTPRTLTFENIRGTTWGTSAQ